LCQLEFCHFLLPCFMFPLASLPWCLCCTANFSYCQRALTIFFFRFTELFFCQIFVLAHCNFFSFAFVVCLDHVFT
jgi:hypothetical protein